jgi:hypothetical protein
MSEVPPGGNGTTMRIGREGNGCALLLPVATRPMIPAAIKLHGFACIAFSSPGLDFAAYWECGIFFINKASLTKY